MSEKIYSSAYPSLQLPQKSIFSFCFSDDFPSAGNDHAVIDSKSGQAITRAETKRLSLSFAWGLRHYLTTLGGVKLIRGHTVLIFSPNSIAWPVLCFGSIAAGFIFTPANHSYTAPELAYQWKDSRADLILAHPDLLHTVLDMFKHINVTPEDARKRIVLATLGFTGNVPSGFISMKDLLDKGTLDHEERFDGPLSHETALRCYSSGTTSLPKGVEVQNNIPCPRTD
jgi:acyl-CoA synthetase (AMP-forming)/AMP-acid ligase II